MCRMTTPIRTIVNSMGNLFDLSVAGHYLPDRVVIDSNLIVVHLLAAFPTPDPVVAARAAWLFGGLVSGATLAIVTPTIAAEVFHIAVKARYRAELPNHGLALARALPGRKRFDWIDLYKLDPTILQRFGPALQRLRQVMLRYNLYFLQPDDFQPMPPEAPTEEALLDLMSRYGLDSNDAAILLEAQRAGITSIATLDRDLQRAAPGFDIYTWLCH